jgi:hypothetical protein
VALSRPIVIDPVRTNLPGGPYVGLAVGSEVGADVKLPVGVSDRPGAVTAVPDPFAEMVGDEDAGLGVHPAADSAMSAAAAQATSRNR